MLKWSFTLHSYQSVIPGSVCKATACVLVDGQYDSDIKLIILYRLTMPSETSIKLEWWFLLVNLSIWWDISIFVMQQQSIHIVVIQFYKFIQTIFLTHSNHPVLSTYHIKLQYHFIRLGPSAGPGARPRNFCRNFPTF